MLPSAAEKHRTWFQALAASPPEETVELLSNLLPSLLAARDETTLRHPSNLRIRWSVSTLHTR
jgi:hypothetical protein